MLFTFAGGEGHLRPLLPVAEAAAAAGHDVLVSGAANLSGRTELPYEPSGPDVEAVHSPPANVNSIRAIPQQLPRLLQARGPTLERMDDRHHLTRRQAIGAAGTAFLIGLFDGYVSAARPWHGAPRLAGMRLDLSEVER